MGNETGEDGWADCFAGVVAAHAVTTKGDSFNFMKKIEETSVMESWGNWAECPLRSSPRGLWLA